MKAKIHYKDTLTSKQKNAMDEEIRSQILEQDDFFIKECDAQILWTLHACFGFGKKRLKRFWEACFEEHQSLRENYQMKPEDDGWLYRRKLERIGVNIDDWYDEKQIIKR